MLEILAVSKSFPGVRALHNVSFDVAHGEVHALMGENGAGKSTLMKILSGVYTDFDGELRLDGEPLRLGGPADRCQVLRWLIAERPDSDDHLLEVLRSALDDRDLEVRLTAILAAGRLDLRSLRSAVYRTPLAAGRREGFDARGRALLLALRDAVVALLDRKLVVWLAGLTLGLPISARFVR